VIRTVYMDCHATTPVDPRVLEAMLPYFTEHFGNAASRTHGFGTVARRAVDRARQQVAELIGANPREIVFTSGATESNNLAIKGVVPASASRGHHVVTAVTEHRAVLDPCASLERRGCRVTRLGVSADGRVDVADLERALTHDTVLVTVMAANNEIGVIQPIEEIGAATRYRRVLFHTDAAQAAGKIPLDVDALHVDLLSLSGHKMYGPKGVGALYVRRRDPRVDLEPLLDGGGQERGLRSGTLNVPGIVGLGKAAAICRDELAREAERVRTLRDRLCAGLVSSLEGVRVNGSMTHRLPNNLNISVAGVEGDPLLLALTDVAVSSGAACMSSKPEPPYVLNALGVEGELARASLRFGLGRFTTEEEVDFVIGRVAEVVTRLRNAGSQLAGTDKVPTTSRPESSQL
jgi:cysteine desulfurase